MNHHGAVSRLPRAAICTWKYICRARRRLGPETQMGRNRRRAGGGPHCSGLARVEDDGATFSPREQCGLRWPDAEGVVEVEGVPDNTSSYRSQLRANASLTRGSFGGLLRSWHSAVESIARDTLQEGAGCGGAEVFRLAASSWSLKTGADERI